MSPVESAPRSGALGTQFLKEIHEQPDALLRLLAHEKTIARAAQLAVIVAHECPSAGGELVDGEPLQGFTVSVVHDGNCRPVHPDSVMPPHRHTCAAGSSDVVPVSGDEFRTPRRHRKTAALLEKKCRRFVDAGLGYRVKTTFAS